MLGTVPNGMKGVLKLSEVGIWTIPLHKGNEQNAHVYLLYVSFYGFSCNNIGVGYCLLFVYGSPEPRPSNDNSFHAFLPPLILLYLGNYSQKADCLFFQSICDGNLKKCRLISTNLN